MCGNYLTTRSSAYATRIILIVREITPPCRIRVTYCSGLVSSPVRMNSTPFSVFINVSRFRQEESEKRFLLKAASLRDSKQTEVMLGTFLAE